MTCPITLKDKNFHFTPLPKDVFSYSDRPIDENSIELNGHSQGRAIRIWVDRKQIAQKLYLQEVDVMSINENPVKFIHFLKRVNGLIGKFPYLTEQVHSHYPKSRFISKEEIEQTAKKLARLNVYDPSTWNERLSAQKFDLPITVCSTQKKLFFNIPESNHGEGTVRTCKASISEDGEIVARVTGEIEEPLQWKNEKQSLQMLNGKRGIITTYGCYQYESKKEKPKSTTLHPLFQFEFHHILEMGPHNLSPKIRDQIASQILYALVSMSESVVHCDLTPPNIVYRINKDSSITLAVIDFQFAQLLDRLQPFEGGSADFVSPERCIRGSQVSPKWDVWSVGVILHLLYIDKIPSC